MVSFFIHRPIFASSIAVIMVLAGAICYFLLPVSQFPDITPPQVVVSAAYPGASAQVVADTVTTPLEQQINGVQGMTYMSSSSSNDGSSTITVTFDVGYPLSIAAVDVQNRVAQAAASLPPIVNQGGVIIKKQNPNFVLIVNLVSPDRSVDPVALSNYAYLQVVDPLKRVPGVGDVQIFGERRYSMRIWLDPDKLAKLGITAVDVQQAVAEQNVQVAAGKIGQSPAPEGTPFEMQVNATGRLSDPDQFGDIVVRSDPASGAIVRMKDIARIELGALQYSSTAVFGKDPTVVLAVFQMPGSNALDLQQHVKEKMEELSKRFPKGIEYGLHYDTTRFVKAAKRDVIITLSEALALVILVVFIFLQNWRTTLIPTIAIPVSLIATLAVMQVMGFSLNMLSLLGMVLAIGLVVDDAIVVVEAVEHHIENGLSPRDATLKAMEQVSGPVMAIALIRERGYERATIDEIARRADVSQPTFYKYYPGKDAILREHEENGTFSDPEYAKASEVFYKRHVCRIDPSPQNGVDFPATRRRVQRSCKAGNGCAGDQACRRDGCRSQQRIAPTKPHCHRAPLNAWNLGAAGGKHSLQFQHRAVGCRQHWPPGYLGDPFCRRRHAVLRQRDQIAIAQIY